MPMLMQIVSLVGAVLILAAYAMLQAGRLDRASRTFCLANLVGSALLTWIAIAERNAGFVLLEGSWAVLSLLPLLRRRA